MGKHLFCANHPKVAPDGMLILIRLHLMKEVFLFSAEWRPEPTNMATNSDLKTNNGEIRVEVEMR